MLAIAQEEQEKFILGRFETVSVLRRQYCENALGVPEPPTEDLAMRAYKIGWRYRYWPNSRLACPHCNELGSG